LVNGLVINEKIKKFDEPKNLASGSFSQKDVSAQWRKNQKFSVIENSYGGISFVGRE
jgi:hypothetical protein